MVDFLGATKHKVGSWNDLLLYLNTCFYHRAAAICPCGDNETAIFRFTAPVDVGKLWLGNYSTSAIANHHDFVYLYFEAHDVPIYEGKSSI